MESLPELYERLGALCRRQVECIAMEDLDGLERLLAGKDTLLQRIALAQPPAQMPPEGAGWERATAAALAAAATEKEAERLLKEKLADVRERLCRAGGGRAALRSYRPASAPALTVDRYS